MRFYATGNAGGINPNHAQRIRVRLGVMDVARSLQDINQPGWNLHPLRGNRHGVWSIHINGLWCLTFEFDDASNDCLNVDYEQYH